MVAENAIGVLLSAGKEGLVDEKDINEFRTELDSHVTGSFRHWFHIFTRPILTLNDGSYEKLQENADSKKPQSQKIPIYRLEYVWRDLLGGFPPSKITQAIASIQVTSRIMIDAFKSDAHDEIDAGLLILVSANILRLIEISPDKVLSAAGKEEVSQLKEIAASIFKDELNFKSIYFSDDDGPQDKPSADISANESVDSKQGERKNSPVSSIDVSVAVLRAVKPLMKSQMTDIATAVNKVTTALIKQQRAKQITRDEFSNIVETVVNHSLEKQVADISATVKKDIVPLLNKQPASPSKPETSPPNNSEVSINVMDTVKVLLQEQITDLSAAVKKDVSDLLEKQLSEFSSVVASRKVSDEAGYPDIEELPDGEFYDDTPFDEIEEKPALINYSQASDKLYELRNEIREGRPELEIEPWKNILQGPFIKEMLDKRVKTLAEWKNAPKIKYRYERAHGNYG